MTKQEFLSASLPYGLQIYYEWDGEIAIKLVGLSYNYKHIYLELKHPHKRETDISLIECAGKPIIRPLSDLTKPIVQADYNDGKPFVPIVELAKIAYPKAIKQIRLLDDGVCVIDTSCNYVFVYVDEDDSFNCTYLPEDRNCYVKNQFQLFQQMIRWHFDLIDEDCEKVYVTDEFNPYK